MLLGEQKMRSQGDWRTNGSGTVVMFRSLAQVKGALSLHYWCGLSELSADLRQEHSVVYRAGTADSQTGTRTEQEARYQMMSKAKVGNGARSGNKDRSEAESKIRSGPSQVSNKGTIQDNHMAEGTTEHQSAQNMGLSIL